MRVTQIKYIIKIIIIIMMTSTAVYSESYSSGVGGGGGGGGMKTHSSLSYTILYPASMLPLVR